MSLFKKKPPPEILVELRKDGPLVVHGNILVKDSDGNETKKSNLTFFCRCGESAKKPFCDGKHKAAGFTG